MNVRVQNLLSGIYAEALSSEPMNFDSDEDIEEGELKVNIAETRLVIARVSSKRKR